MRTNAKRINRVVLLYWKDRKGENFEVFSNLKNLTDSYPQFNYNTLSNYLSKAKTAFENEQVIIERKQVIAQPKPIYGRNISQVVRKVLLKDADEKQYDLEFWLKKGPLQRLEAVTALIQTSKTENRLNKTIVNKVKMK